MKKQALLIVLALVSAFTAGFLIGRHAALRQHPPAKRYIVTAPAVIKKEAVTPAAPRKFNKPKVAIVMDDFGYNMNNLEDVFNIKEPITFSILPGLPYSGRIARMARSRGYETILHLPLESYRKDVVEEASTIRGDMNEKEVVAKLRDEMKTVQGLSGVSNHMGSKATEDRKLMATIFGELKRSGLYFFDSLTSRKSICAAEAAAIGLRCAKRDIFLDNTDDVDYVKRQLTELKKAAFRKGRVIAVCHDRKNTIAALSEMMPQMAKDGVEFVNLSELVR